MIIKTKTFENHGNVHGESKTIYRRGVPIAQLLFNGSSWIVSERNGNRVQTYDSEHAAIEAIPHLKGESGRFYTENSKGNNPFAHEAFIQWARNANLPEESMLEPFAGRNSIIDLLRSLDLCHEFKAYDILPAREDVQYRDSLADFPVGHRVCVSNPPWLARNVATRNRLDFPKGIYQDLYQFCLERCLANCQWVALLLPESFIRTNLFRERLTDVISLTFETFRETTHPVALALFAPNEVPQTRVWSGAHLVGDLSEIEAHKPKINQECFVRFNDPNGNVGLYALDNTREESIRFCEPEELGSYQVVESSRAITKILTVRPRIKEWNDFLKEFRRQTHDVLLTPYRGLRADGMYRRRLDYDLARRIIQNV